MKHQKSSWSNWMFWLQLTLATIYGVAQCIRMFTSTQGVSTTMFGFTLLFCIFLLILSVNAYKNTKNVLTTQNVITYVWGVLLYCALTIVVIWQGKTSWDIYDTVTTILVLVAIVISLRFAKSKTFGFTHPITRSYLALSFRVIPQSIMAYKIALFGGSGISWLMILCFMTMVVLRIGQIIASRKNNKDDLNLKSLLVAEIGNLSSWILVTIAWLYRLI